MDKVAANVWLCFPLLLRLEGIDLSLNSHAFSIVISGSAESNVGRGHNNPFCEKLPKNTLYVCTLKLSVLGCEITVKRMGFQLLAVKMFLTITAYHKPRKGTCTDQDVPSGASSGRVCPELTEQRKENKVMISIGRVRDLAWLGGGGWLLCKG